MCGKGSSNEPERLKKNLMRETGLWELDCPASNCTKLGCSHHEPYRGHLMTDESQSRAGQGRAEQNRDVGA